LTGVGTLATFRAMKIRASLLQVVRVVVVD